MLATTLSVEVLIAAGCWYLAIIVFFVGQAFLSVASKSCPLQILGAGFVVSTVPIIILAIYCTYWVINHVPL